MPPPETTRRFVAVVLSLLVPGMAQFVWGRPEVGAMFLGLAVLVWLVLLLATRYVDALPWWLVLVGLGFHVVAAWDAGRLSRGERRRRDSRLP